MVKMTSTSSSASINSHSVVPPILVNEKDRRFLNGLNDWLNSELCQIDQRKPDQRYIVYKEAFEKVISHVSAYKPLLSTIKDEYESCIETIRRGQQETLYLTGKLNEMRNEPGTLQYNQERSKDLRQKASLLEDDIQKLQQQWDTVHAARMDKDQKRHPPANRDPVPGGRPIPGLTLEQSTDVKFLTKELERLDQQYRELSVSHNARYAPRGLKESLKNELAGKIEQKERLQDHVKQLKVRHEQLAIAVKAATEYLSTQPTHQTIGEAVLLALAKQNAEGRVDSPMSTGDDPVEQPNGTGVGSREAELLLDYIDKFTEMFEAGRFAEAARHAANSPKGILRTPETMLRFKDAAGATRVRPSPWLVFCEALMSTVPAFPSKPNEFMSEDCVRCALHEHRIDLLTHWIAQNRLTLNERCGDLIYGYWAGSTSGGRAATTSSSSHTGGDVASCLSIAQKVYTDVKAHVSAIVCMCKQGRLVQALQYAQMNNASPDELCQVLRRFPDVQLARNLYETVNRSTEKSLLPLGAITTSLLETEAFRIGLTMLQDLYLRGPQEVGSESSLLRAAVLADDVTSHEQWVDIVQAMQSQGYREAAMDLLSAVTSIFSEGTDKTTDLPHGVATRQDPDVLTRRLGVASGATFVESHPTIPAGLLVNPDVPKTTTIRGSEITERQIQTNYGAEGANWTQYSREPPVRDVIPERGPTGETAGSKAKGVGGHQRRQKKLITGRPEVVDGRDPRGWSRERKPQDITSEINRHEEFNLEGKRKQQESKTYGSPVDDGNPQRLQNKKQEFRTHIPRPVPKKSVKEAAESPSKQEPQKDKPGGTTALKSSAGNKMPTADRHLDDNRGRNQADANFQLAERGRAATTETVHSSNRQGQREMVANELKRLMTNNDEDNDDDSYLEEGGSDADWGVDSEDSDEY